MAVDHALAEQLTPGSAVLRLYEWTEPTVSFGRNEVARDQYARTDQVAFVRRPTGGRAVLHREELTYSVVFPAAKGLRQAYAEIHAALKAGLEALGVRGRLAPQGDAVSPLEPGTCFEHPVGGEILVDAGKLVGSAQARMGSAVLQHGSLLRVEDQTGFDRIRRRPEHPSSPAPTLASVLGSAPPRVRDENQGR